MLWLPVSAQEIPADVEPLWIDMLSIASSWLSQSPMTATAFLRREKLLSLVLSPSGADQWDLWIASTVAKRSRVPIQLAFTRETRRRLLEAKEADAALPIPTAPTTVNSCIAVCTQTEPVIIMNSSPIKHFSLEEVGAYLGRKLDVLRLFGAPKEHKEASLADEPVADPTLSMAPVAKPGPIPLFGQSLTQSEPDPEETPRSLEDVASVGAVSEGHEEVLIQDVFVDAPEFNSVIKIGDEENEEHAENTEVKWETGSVYGGSLAGSMAGSVSSRLSMASNSSSGSYRYKRGQMKNPRSANASRMQWYTSEAPW